MVQITRPVVAQPQATASIGPGATTALANAGAVIGQATSQFGAAVQREGLGDPFIQFGRALVQQNRNQLAAARNAEQAAIASNAMNEATVKFIEQKNQRAQTLTDDKGNPVFATLVEDVGKLGSQVAQEAAKNISDPVAKQKFLTKFNSYVTNQQVLSMGEARRQQISFAKSSLDNGLGSLLQQGTSDDVGNVESYVGQAQEMLNDYLSGGVISPSERDSLLANFSESVRFRSLNSVVLNNRAQASKLLTADASQLKISEQSKQKLDATLEAGIKSDKIQELKSQRLLEETIQTEIAQAGSEIEKRILTDSIREDELLAQKDNLGPQLFSKLSKKFVSEAKKRQREQLQMQEIATDIARGGSSNDFSSGKVDKFYENRLAALEGQLGRPTTLAERAELAVGMNGRVNTFSKMMNQGALTASPGASADILSAYTFSRDMGGKALSGSGFTNKAEDILEFTEMLVERGGMNPQEAMSFARERVLGGTDAVREGYRKEFNRLKDFKLDNITNTAADELDAEDFFFRNKPLGKGVADTYRRITEAAYISTGDIDSAKKIAAERMKKTHGFSNANPEEEFMFSPPEKLFPFYEGRPELLRANIIKDATPFLPSGVAPENVKIESDPMTRGFFVPTKNGKREVISYAMAYERDGITLPLVNPDTGELVRWFPDQTADIKKERERLAQAASPEARRAQRESDVRSQEVISNITIDTGAAL